MKVIDPRYGGGDEDIRAKTPVNSWSRIVLRIVVFDNIATGRSHKVALTVARRLQLHVRRTDSLTQPVCPPVLSMLQKKTLRRPQWGR